MNEATALNVGSRRENAWVLLQAPFREDEKILTDFLAENGIEARIAATNREFEDLLAERPWFVVLTQEAITREKLDLLSEHMVAQPEWSNLPLLLLVSPDGSSGSFVNWLRAKFPDWPLTVLQRRMRREDLQAAVSGCLQARSRQFDLRDKIARQEVLRREISHRYKNVLANVSAISLLSARKAHSIDDFLTGFTGRIAALSNAHSMLAKEKIDACSMHDLADSVVSPYRAEEGERVGIEGPDVRLPSNYVANMGLILHELATNAAKYGSLSVPEGRVRLTTERLGSGSDPVLGLTWSEVGGPPAAVPTRQGFGTSFIKSLVRVMKGDVAFDWSETGLTCSFRLPLSE